YRTTPRAPPPSALFPYTTLFRSDEKLDWLGKMDSGSLKMKVAASIVAISSIHLLRMFMDAQQLKSEQLMWYVIIHLTFVFSAFRSEEHTSELQSRENRVCRLLLE